MTPRARIEFVRLAIAMLLALVPVTMAFLAVPSFKSVFMSFAGSPPAVTAMTIRFYPLAAMLPLLMFAVWLFEPAGKARGMFAVWIAVACVVLAPIFLGIVMYLPILQIR